MIHIYDFDGVLADPTEDAIYRLPVTSEEQSFLDRTSEFYDFRRDHDDAYTRHVAVQYCLADLRLPIEAGPCLASAQVSQDPMFILTARSAPPAVDRVNNFLRQFKLNPQETFFVGRAGKIAQLSYVCQNTSDVVRFYDDSPAHIEAAKALGLSNLESFLVKPFIDFNRVETLYQEIIDFSKRL